MKRRDILSTFGTGISVLLAGCGSNSGSARPPTSKNPPGNESKISVPPPKAQLPDGWKLTTPNTEAHVLAEGSISIIDWQAVGHTRRYENKKLRKRIKKETLGKVNRPLVVGFATRVELDVLGGDITESLITQATDKVQNRAKKEFRHRMKRFGLESVNETGSLIRGKNDSPTKFFQYQGKYTVPSITVDKVNIPNVRKNSFKLSKKKLPIEGLLGVWRENDHIFIAGGVYPGKDYMATKTWDITDSVHLRLRVELGFSRQQHMANVIDFAKSVHA